MRRPVSAHGGFLLAALATAVLSSSALADVPADKCYRDESGRIVHRRQPGYQEVPCPPGGPPAPNAPAGTALSPEVAQGPEANSFPGGRGTPTSTSPLPRPQATDLNAPKTVPDRWHLVDQLPGYAPHLSNPYDRNVLKADRPFAGNWFFDLGLLSDTEYQVRDIPTAVGGVSTHTTGENDVFGNPRQQAVSQSITTELTLYQGDTVFMPPRFQFRAAPVFNYNYLATNELGVVNVDPRHGTNRSDNFVGLEEFFGEVRLHVASERFDFDSVRLGIQPFNADFRGFLFQDNQLGVRFFGTRNNNIIQYNVAYFRLLDKDTNSGLNSVTKSPRHSDVFVANLYRQDTPTPGFTSQVTVLYNRDHEAGETHYNDNGFLVVPAALGIEQPRDFDVVYLGYNGDGHFDRLNLTTSLYYAVGHDTPGTFVNQKTQVRAGFAAAELSRDFNWLRGRISLLYATGDRHPHGDTETGFDAPFENPQFAGGNSSYWISQALPLIGGGGVTLSQSNSVLNSLRSSKDEGQSNFANPGTGLAGIGVDADVLPTLRLTANANDLYFAATETLEVARNQAPIDNHIGTELSFLLTWRPLNTQNIVVRLAYAHLFPGAGYRDLFPGQSPNYGLVNVLLVY